TLVYEKLKQVKILPSEVCTDAEFIRRIYLDLTGLPPQPDDVRKFLADSRPTRVKRDELVDKLVGNADFVEHWTNKWADLLQVSHKEDPHFKGKKVGGTDVMGALPEVEIILDQAAGEVKHERTGVTTPPVFPYKITEQIPAQGTRRQQLARWTTSKENPYFAKSYVNRIWSYLLGVGLIEPIDDIRAGNPPTNPKLLDKLTDEFVKSNFDVQLLMKTICKSRTYQHAIEANAWNKDDDQNYSHAVARRLPAEVLY